MFSMVWMQQALARLGMRESLNNCKVHQMPVTHMAAVCPVSVLRNWDVQVSDI